MKVPLKWKVCSDKGKGIHFHKTRISEVKVMEQYRESHIGEMEEPVKIYQISCLGIQLKLPTKLTSLQGDAFHQHMQNHECQ